MSDEIINIQSLRSIDSLPISDTGPHLLDYERVRAHITRAIERRRYSGSPEPQQYLLDRRCLVLVGNEFLVTPLACSALATTPRPSSPTRP